MRKIFWLLPFVFLSITLHSQVVINEVEFENQVVEIKNISNVNIDVTNYYLVSGNTSRRIGQYLPFCGPLEFILTPNEIFGFNGMLPISWMEGEVVLYSSNQFADTSSLKDFMEWGNAGHQHEAISVEAGEWTNGDFVPAILDGGSLEFDGDGNSSSDWSSAAAVSICYENGTGCTVGIGTVFPNNNPFHACVGDGNPDGFGYTFTGNTSQHQRVIVVDGNNIIRGYSEPGTGIVDLESLQPSDTSGLHWVYAGYNGPLGNLVIGGSLDGLVGCYVFADPVPIHVSFVNQGELQITYHDTLFTDNFSMCASDLMADHIKGYNTSTDYHQAFILINVTTGRVYDILLDSIDLDLEGVPLTKMRIRSFSYSENDTIEGQIGGSPFSVHAVSGCDAWTTNEILITMDHCASAVFDNRIQTVYSYPDPATDILYIKNIIPGKGELRIYDLRGVSRKTDWHLANEKEIAINVSGLPAGLFFIQIKYDDQILLGKFLKSNNK